MERGHLQRNKTQKKLYPTIPICLSASLQNPSPSVMHTTINKNSYLQLILED